MRLLKADLNNPSFRPSLSRLACMLIVVILLAGSLKSSAAPAPSPRGTPSAGEGRRWAVLVGIDEYQKQVTPLMCAVRDAREMEATLVGSCGFRPDDVFLLTSDQKGNRMPDRLNVIAWLEYVAEHARPQDTLVFFFSGHGVETDGENFLLTIEADPSSRRRLEMSSLRSSDLAKAIQEVPARRVLVFVDACRNDPRSGKGEADNRMGETFSRDLERVGRPATSGGDAEFCYTFLSCQVGQRAYEWRERGMGFFTYYLTRGLLGEARDGAGHVTLASLRTWLGDKVNAAVQRERGAQYVQTPRIRGEGSVGADGWIINAKPSLGLAGSPVASPAGSPVDPVVEAVRTLYRSVERGDEQAFGGVAAPELKARLSDTGASAEMFGAVGMLTCMSREERALFTELSLQQLSVEVRDRSESVAHADSSYRVRLCTQGQAMEIAMGERITLERREGRWWVVSCEAREPARWLKSRADARLAACRANQNVVRTALSQYALDHDGLYPLRLADVVPKYLPAIPTCPAVDRDTYSASYRVDARRRAFRFSCAGRQHTDAGQPPDHPVCTEPPAAVPGGAE